MIFNKPAPYIPDYFRDVVAKTAAALNKPIHFDFGHYEYVTGRQQGKAQTKSKERYPLIWLVMDFEEQRYSMNNVIQLTPSPMIIIATNTQPELSMEQRRDQKFLPILYPIYDEFLNQISKSKAFGQPANVKHVKVDRPYWKGEGGAGNLFTDFIDAIQLKNFQELQIKIQC